LAQEIEELQSIYLRQILQQKKERKILVSHVLLLRICFVTLIGKDTQLVKIGSILSGMLSKKAVIHGAPSLLDQRKSKKNLFKSYGVEVWSDIRVA